MSSAAEIHECQLSINRLVRRIAEEKVASNFKTAALYALVLDDEQDRLSRLLRSARREHEASSYTGAE